MDKNKSGSVQIDIEGVTIVFNNPGKYTMKIKKFNRVKHFLGWLFRYCPYGGTCPPHHPFKQSLHESIMDNGVEINKILAGGGC